MSVQEGVRARRLEADPAQGRRDRPGNPGPRHGRCAFLKQRTGTKRSVCRARASYRVGVALREQKNGPAVTVFVKLVCCSSCRRSLTKKDVLTRSGFRKMASFAFEKHQMVAKYSRTTLDFDRL